MFECELCSYKTERNDNYQRHIESKKHINKTENIMLNKLYKCDECDYKTQYKSNLNRHKKLKQTNVDKLHVCEVCNYKTLNNIMFDNHITSDKHRSLIEKLKIESIVEKVMDKINTNQTSVVSRQLNESDILEKVINLYSNIITTKYRSNKNIRRKNHNKLTQYKYKYKYK